MIIMNMGVRLRNYKRGDRLKHESLGSGTFIRICRNNTANGVSMTYEIKFDGVGIKELIPAFAHGKLHKIRKGTKK